MISTDRNIFFEGSAVRERMIEYGDLFDALHIVIPTYRRDFKKETRISNRVVLHPTNSKGKISARFDLIRLGKKLSADIVTAQDPFENGFAAWRVARALRAKLQLQIHVDMGSPHFRKSLLNKMRLLCAQFLLPRADCIRVVLQKTKTELMEKGIPVERISVLPIYVDVKKFQEASGFPVRSGYKEFSSLVLFMGRLEREKQPEVALRAFAAVSGQYKAAGLLFVGEGSERARLEALAHSRGLSERVHFLGWRNNTAEFLKAADVLVVPSLYEGYGLVIIEALAAGVPVLSFDVGVAREAGAIITADSSLPRDLSAVLEQKPRGILLGYPYRSKEEYLAVFKNSFIQCGNI